MMHCIDEFVPVVSGAYAVAYPGAMVVEALDAVVAEGAVRRARRTENATRVAKFKLHFHPVDLN